MFLNFRDSVLFFHMFRSLRGIFVLFVAFPRFALWFLLRIVGSFSPLVSSDEVVCVDDMLLKRTFPDG